MTARAEASSSFLLNVDRDEKASRRGAAGRDGLSISECMRLAMRESIDQPTLEEIAAACTIAAQISAAAGRITDKLDHTLTRIDAMLDPAREAERRREILAKLKADGLDLGLDMLARAHA